MTDETANDPGIGSPPADAAESAPPVAADGESGETVVQSATHHGEALVAALLSTKRTLQQAVPAADNNKVTATEGSPPLTASSFLNHLPPGAAQPDFPIEEDLGLTDPAIPQTLSGRLLSQQPQSDDPSPRAGSALLTASGTTLADAAEQGAVTPVKSDSAAESVETDIGDGGATGETSDSNEEEEEVEKDSLARNFMEWVVVLGAAVAVAVILRTFVFQAFYIPSESMETTLYKDDRLLVNKVSYRLHDVNRGDVVVFHRAEDDVAEIRDLIKRVIGLPGETVEGRGGVIYINDQQLVEPYLDGSPFGDFGPTTVPEGEFFMMGDNRDDSLDSRRFGTVPEERLVGRAFVLFWPFNRIGSL